MISDYARELKEKQVEEEMKWADMEAQYVQGAIRSMDERPRQAIQHQRKRAKNKVSKPRAH